MTWSGLAGPAELAGRKLPLILALGIGAAIYFALARAGLAFAFVAQNASPVWPAAGFAVALLAIGGPRLAPAIFLGTLAANIHYAGWANGAALAGGSMLGAMAGAWTIGRFARFDHDIFPLARAAGILAAAFVAAFVSATIGTFSLSASGALGPGEVERIAFIWWCGDVLGILLVAPLLTALAQYANGIEPGARAHAPARPHAHPRAHPAWHWRAATGLAFLASALGISALAVFAPDTASAFLPESFPAGELALFLAVPAVVAAARWSGPIAAHLAMLAMAAFWLVVTANGHGPFAGETPDAAFRNIQVLLAGYALATLIFTELQQTRSLIPAALLMIGCLLAAAVFFGLRHVHREIDDRHLVNIATRTQNQIQDRMEIYVAALRGGASLYAAARSVGRIGWQRYVDSLELLTHYPGLRGIGVILPVDRASARTFVDAMRRDVRPDFAIRPFPNAAADAADTFRRQHFVIAHFEPDTKPDAAIGFDIAAEPTRYLAATLARDTGNPTLSGRITLIGDGRDEPGFAMYVPIYREPPSATSPEMLRWYFHGWIYAPFTAREFFSRALIAESAELRLRIHDGPHADPATLVFDSDAAAATPFRADHRSQMILLDREFTIAWQASPLFEREDPLLPVAFSAGGVIVSALLAALMATLLTQKDRASSFADRMSSALALANERFELAVECSKDVLWDHDVLNGTTWASPHLAAMFGYADSDVAGDYWAFWRRIMDPADHARMRGLYDEMLAGQRGGIETVLRYRRRDGRLMHVQTRCLSVLDAEGRVVRVIGVDTDITLVKQLELRLRDAISVMVDGFALFDADDRLILFNDGFLDQVTREMIGDPTGLTFREIIEVFAAHRVPATDPDFDAASWVARRLERHRNPPADPFEMIWSGGRIMRVSERRTSDGGYVGIWTDVTETKRLGQRLEDAIAVLNDGFALYDAEDRLLLCNDSYMTPEVKAHFGARYLGCTFEEIYRAYARLNIGMAEGPELDSWLEHRAALHRDPREEPYEITTHDGYVLRVLERRTKEGGTVGLWTDVTALRRAEQRLKDAIESINEGFLLLDAEGRYVVYNRPLMELYPKTAAFVKEGGLFADALRKGAEAGEYPQLDTPPEIDAFVAEWVARFRDPTPFQGVAPLAGGGWVLVSHRPTSDGGCVNVYTDITALKDRESDLAEANGQLQRQAQALTVLAEELRGANLAAHQANLSKSQFLANMSHELRTPLNGIIGFSDIIRTEMFGTMSPPRYRDYAEDIHRSGQHLLNLINDILDLSKIEAGRMSLRLEAVASEEALGQALRMVQPLAETRRVTLRPPLIEDCPILHADERQLKQVLLNLLSNAVKFTPDGGAVDVAIRSAGDAGAIITVRDNGIGMTPQEVSIALERFGQADSSLAKTSPGTGLGLPLVDGLVKLHDGRLEIESEKGKGTQVTVHLPWRPDLPRA